MPNRRTAKRLIFVTCNTLIIKDFQGTSQRVEAIRFRRMPSLVIEILMADTATLP